VLQSAHAAIPALKPSSPTDQASLE
jgi:hypothetical protein